MFPNPGPFNNASEAALREGFDLPAVLIGLADIPEGAKIESEGFVEDSDAISSLHRIMLVTEELVTVRWRQMEGLTRFS